MTLLLEKTRAEEIAGAEAEEPAQFLRSILALLLELKVL